MSDKIEYDASCHCGAIRFRFRCEPITSGSRCNCSICIRKGIVVSAGYIPPVDVEQRSELGQFKRYRFGDRCLDHCFCGVCGITVYSIVDNIPEGYKGPAQPGCYRINLGCVDGLDVYALPINVLDGRSL
jgi:hypothetical protein